MNPENTPGRDEHREVTEWERSLQNLSFTWTDPRTPLRATEVLGEDAERLVQEQSVLHHTFSRLLREEEDLAEAYNRCKGMIERTTGEDYLLGAKVMIWLQFALVERVMIEDIGEQATLFQEQVASRYLHPYHEETSKRLARLGNVSSRWERAGYYKDFSENLVKDTDEVLKKINMFGKETLEGYKEYLSASVDRAILYAGETERENIEQLGQLMEPYARTLFSQEIELRLIDGRESVQRLSQSFRATADRLRK